MAAGDISVEALRYSPGGKHLALAVRNNLTQKSNLQLWKMPERTLVRQWPSSPVLSLQFSHDSNYIAAATATGVRIWKTDSTVQMDKEINPNVDNLALAFSPTEDVLAIAGEKIQLWDLDTTEPKSELPLTSGWAVSIAYSPDGKIVAVGDTRGSIHFLDSAGLREIATTPAHPSWILSSAFSSDGKMLLSGDANGELDLWSADGKRLRTLPLADSGIRALAMQPKETIVAASFDDHTVRLMDTVSGRTLRTMSCGSGFVSGVAFSPEGHILATGATVTPATRAPGLFVLALDPVSGGSASSRHGLSALADRFSNASSESFEKTISIKLDGDETQSSIQGAITTIARAAQTTDTAVLLFRDVSQAQATLQQFGDWIPKIQANNLAVLIEGPNAQEQADAVRSAVERDRKYGGTKNVVVLAARENIAPPVDEFLDAAGKVTAAGIQKAVLRAKAEQHFAGDALLIGNDFPLGFVGKASADARGFLLKPAAAESDTPGLTERHDYAVLFATNRYNEFGALVNPVADAHALADELQKNYEFQTDVVENPTVDEVFSKLRSLRERNFSSGDQLLIFFAGHGTFDEESSEGFLVARDSHRDDPNKTSYISYSRLRTLVDGLPAKHIFLVMDVCFGGTFDRRIAEGGSRSGDEYAMLDLGELLDRKMRLPTRKYLTSGAKEYVPDGIPGHHSPFAAHLLEALRTYGGPKGYLTISSLLANVEATKPEPVWGDWGHDEPGSDFLFVPKETKDKLARGNLTSTSASTGKNGPEVLPPAGFVPRRSVALLGLEDLASQSDTSWISPTLTTVLSTEVAKDEDILLIPGETVAITKSDLRLVASDSYSSSTLSQLRDNLHADIVIAGSVLALGKPGVRQIRIDLRIQDTAQGTTVGVVSESGTESDFLSLVTRAGAELRYKLGTDKNDSAGDSQSSLWKNPEAAHLYAEGQKQMESFSAATARDLFQRSAVIEPDVALTHMGLSGALFFLGYDSLAQDEAKRGFELSGPLSREPKLLVAAQYYSVTGDWDDAINTYRSLWTFYPDNLEYGLSLANAQTSGGHPNEASETITTMRRLPPPYTGDPRIDLAEANAAMVLSDWQREAEAAGRAKVKTESLGAKQLLALSLWYQCVAKKQLGQYDEALASCKDGEQLFESFGNRRFVARCVTGIANIYELKGDLEHALQQHQKALEIVRQATAMKDVSGALVNVASVLSSTGDVEGAQRNYAEASQISRQIGDREGEALAELALGSFLDNIGHFDTARQHFETAEPLFRDLHDNAHVAMCRAYSAVILWGKGYIDLALERLQPAIEYTRASGSKSSLTEYLVYLGDVYRSQGKVTEAEASYSESLAIAKELGEKAAIANSEMRLALLALERDQFTTALSFAQEATEEFAAEHDEDDEASSLSIVAEALLEKKDVSLALAKIEQVQKLKITSPTTRLTVEMATARVYVLADKRAEADAEISRLLQDASGVALWEPMMEARLTQNEVRIALGQSDLARADLRSLAEEASGRGFDMIAVKARKLAR